MGLRSELLQLLSFFGKKNNMMMLVDDRAINLIEQLKQTGNLNERSIDLIFIFLQSLMYSNLYSN